MADVNRIGRVACTESSRVGLVKLLTKKRRKEKRSEESGWIQLIEAIAWGRPVPPGLEWAKFVCLFGRKLRLIKLELQRPPQMIPMRDHSISCDAYLTKVPFCILSAGRMRTYRSGCLLTRRSELAS